MAVVAQQDQNGALLVCVEQMRPVLHFRCAACLTDLQRLGFFVALFHQSSLVRFVAPPTSVAQPARSLPSVLAVNHPVRRRARGRSPGGTTSTLAAPRRVSSTTLPGAAQPRLRPAVRGSRGGAASALPCLRSSRRGNARAPRHRSRYEQTFVSGRRVSGGSGGRSGRPNQRPR
jgi:hypothetical protein